MPTKPKPQKTTAAANGEYRVRVRMYRHGLGDCFLLSFARDTGSDYHILIDFGALSRNKQDMEKVAKHLRDSTRNGNGKGRIDLVVSTHEHQDHLSGFNQARDVFDQEIDIGAVWMGWTENLTKAGVKKIKETKRKALQSLRSALTSPKLMTAASEEGRSIVEGVSALMEFNGDEEAGDTTGRRTIAQALEYLKKRGHAAGDLQFLEPGMGPLTLPGVNDVRVFVLGPPKDPLLLKGSEVTERMKHDGTIYHLAGTGMAGFDALAAAAAGHAGVDGDRYHPFSAEHRIPRQSPYFEEIRKFVDTHYDRPEDDWRQIDEDWLGAFGQLALDLDNDTNNTSLVLAFEFEKTGEVLLFVGDAQVGNWQSWAKVDFEIPGKTKRLPAHDLLARTVFYKVGHHCSHNATLKLGGLDLMTRDDLVAFVPLDEETARSKITKHTPNGWDMPAKPLFKALKEKAHQRVVISDRDLPPGIDFAGRVAQNELFFDYFLK